MSEESRKLRALLLASSNALRERGHTIDWYLLDKKEFTKYDSSFLGYICLIFDTKTDSFHPAVIHCTVYKGICEAIRKFCIAIENSKPQNLVMGMLYPGDVKEIELYYSNGVLCIHYTEGGCRRQGGKEVEPFIMTKEEVLKLRVLADKIEEKYFFMLEEYVYTCIRI